MRRLLNSDGSVKTTVTPTLDAAKADILKRINTEARQQFALLEGEERWRVIRAQENDETNAFSFEYQHLVARKHLMRSRINAVEAEVKAAPDNATLFAIEYQLAFVPDETLDWIPATLTVRQFQALIRNTLAPGKLGEALNGAEAMEATNGNVRDVMEAYRKTATIKKDRAQALINILISEGVTGFTSDDLTAILNAWPSL